MNNDNGYRVLTKQDLKGVHKDIQADILKAMAAGGVGKRTKKGHTMVLLNGFSILFASTPSDYRGIKNGRAMLRRALAAE